MVIVNMLIWPIGQYDWITILYIITYITIGDIIYINNLYEGVSINGDTPKWMVYNGKSIKKMDDANVPTF
jgi:hypothetical protein